MLFHHLTMVALSAALAVTLAYRLDRKCLSFVAYVSSVLICGSLMSTWPGVFYGPHFYAFTRDLYAGLKVLIALELGFHVLRAFPRAQAVGRTWAIGMLVVIVASVAVGAPWLNWTDWLLSRARINTGTIWLFAGLAVLVLWHNLPLDRWHKAILGGFTAQLVLGMVLGTLVLRDESTFRQFAMMVDPAIASWWIYSALTQRVQSADASRLSEVTAR